MKQQNKEYLQENGLYTVEEFKSAIEIFNKNRDFIMKTICEPIFGVKA